MKSDSIKQILLAALVISCCLILANCSDDKVQGSDGTRIVGDLSQPATLREVVQPADCSDVPGLNSPLTGQLNNVDLNLVKVVMYSTIGVLYGNIRVFANDGSFSMALPCGRRVRLVLADSDWTPTDTLDAGPPNIGNSILDTFWDIDRVVGSVTGRTKDAFDNSLIPGVAVSWVIDGSSGSDATDAEGFFAVGSTMPSGTYSFLFHKDDYAELTQEVVIPELDDLIGHINPRPYPGDWVYLMSLEVLLPPLTANLSGHIRLIDADSGDTVAAASVEVQLILNDNIVSNVMKDTTDAAGLYSFEQVPAADTLSLVVPSFVLAAYTYGPVDSTFELFPGATVINALLITGGGGSFRMISEPDRQ